MMRRVISLFQNIHHNQQGAAAIMFALFLNAAVIASALCLDKGRSLLARSEMTNAASAGSLAAGRKAGNEWLAKTFFKANLESGYQGITYNDSDIVVTINEAENTVSVTPLNFRLPVIIPFATASAGSSANMLISSRSTASMPESNVVPISVMLLYDTSSSMAAQDPVPCPVMGQGVCTKLEAVKEATNWLINNLENSPIESSIAGVLWSDTVTASMPYSDDFAQATAFFENGLQPSPSNSTNALSALEESEALLNQSPQERRLVMLMVDGNLDTVAGNSTIPTDNPPDYAGVPLSDAHRAVAWKCYEIKQAYPKTLSLWTVAYGPEAATPMNLDTLKYCATNQDQYFKATTGVEFYVALNRMNSQAGSLALTQ